MDAALRALNRFGLGARRGERTKIDEPRGWLRAQLEGGPPTLAAPEGASPGAIGDAMRELRMAGKGEKPERREARQRLVDLGTSEVRAALTERLATDRPFVERLVAFWSNHLCVSSGAKVIVAPLAGSYEREVIRAHVLGRFEDMVLASAQHPAMLVYLDNFQSFGPDSQGAHAVRRRGGKAFGLNENYARELLELHTVGVDGGYEQQDVQALAKILTGWTVRGLGGPGGREPGRAQRASAPRQVAPGTPITFVFRDLLHEPGHETVLGKRYAGAGLEQGERVIRDLCRRESTSRFVVTKLVAHFVGDEPAPAAVERVARVFHSSDGDLAAVARALVDEPEAWREDSRKFRTPQDWLVAVLRAIGAREAKPSAPVVLRQLRQPLWSPSSPKGFGDTMQQWADPDSLLNRGELARTISHFPGVGAIDPVSLLDVVDVPEGSPLRGVLADGTTPAADRIALAIAGPAFQWR
jgi:uncharacterized protein (DUF1800 family)